MAYLHGEFKNLNNTTYSVHIISNNDTTEEIIIGENGIYFSGDPVSIDMEVEDTFQHIIMQSATINLVTENYVGNKLFANNARDVKVTIMNDTANKCVFSGYVEPNTFTQPFNVEYDEFSINCTDALATLQYYNYKDITLSNYNTVKSYAVNTSFYDIIQNIFNNILETGADVYYDGSKGLDAESLNDLFNDLGVSELNMIGETFDDVWTAQQTLEEILRYLNLHIVQFGKDFYIFDWATIKRTGVKQFTGLFNGGTKSISSQITTLTGNMHTSSDTNITVTDVYNQIQINCELSELEDIITSPLDEDSLTSSFSNKQPYMTEFSSEGSGDKANNAFNDVIHDGGTTGYKEFKTFEWFLQVMDNPNWKLYVFDDDGTNKRELNTLYEQDANGVFINQLNIPKYMRSHKLIPAILRLGYVEKKNDSQDNSVINKITTNDYLYISVNGNEKDYQPSQTTPDEHIWDDSNLTPEDIIHNHSGIIEYQSNTGGVSLSPVDANTTNYLVFSGKFVLQPIAYESSTDYATRDNNYYAIKTSGATKSEGADANVPRYYPLPDVGGIIPVLLHNNLVTSDNNGEGRYYTRKFYTGTYPKQAIDKNRDYLKDGTPSLHPWTKDKSAHGYKYEYSAVGDGSDRFSKLPILECELIIGNKRLVETNIDEAGNSTFQWYEIGHEPVIDGQVKTTFSLGVNPKIDDYIIGDEFDIQNTIDYTMGVDADGTAIPIKMEDHISGPITFRILGPINLLWNDVVRRHPSFWRHTSWTENNRCVLAHTENIIIQDFQCKIYSDNGGNEINADKDLIYISNENTQYLNKKDDIDFNFVTQLTSDERFEKGIETAIIINNVINMDEQLPLTKLYNNVANTADINKLAKAEEHYIAQYYREYSQPRILLDMDLDSQNISFFSLFKSNPLNKNFFVQSFSNNLKYDSAHVTLKEI
jgi:hypothetical protein